VQIVIEVLTFFFYLLDNIDSSVSSTPEKKLRVSFEEDNQNDSSINLSANSSDFESLEDSVTLSDSDTETDNSSKGSVSITAKMNDISLTPSRNEKGSKKKVKKESKCKSEKRQNQKKIKI